METFGIILLIIAGMLIAGLVLMAWVLLVAARAFLRWTGLITPRRRQPAAYGPPRAFSCGNWSCRMSNPMSARFCRRCGRRLGQSDVIAAAPHAQWARC